MQQQVRTEPGLENFSFLFVLYEGGSGAPATANDVSLYAQAINAQTFPVMADAGGFNVSANTPMSTLSHPQMCAIAPDMTILNCYTGHGGHNQALDAIRGHLAGG